MSLSSPVFRDSNKKIITDLRTFHFRYKNFLDFLEHNSDLKITGLTILLDESDIDLSGLRPCLKYLKYLEIYGRYKSDQAIRDFSFLTECKKLEYFGTDISGEVLPYLANCYELAELFFSGAEEREFKLVFEKLKSLHIYFGPEIVLNLKGCPSLTWLGVDQSRFTSIKLNSDNELNHLMINNLTDTDLSFLSKCKNLKDLYISSNNNNLDLDILKDSKLLEFLCFEGINNLIGNFTNLKSLKYLKLKNVDKMGTNDNSVLPEMSPSLKFLTLITKTEGHLEMKSLSSCINLEKLFIKSLRDTIRIGDISKCKSLKHLCIRADKIRNTKTFEELSSLTTLILHVSKTKSIHAELSKCPLLKSLTLHLPSLDNLRCILYCENLEYLDVDCQREISLDEIQTCPNLEVIIINNKGVRDSTPFLELTNLRELYISSVIGDGASFSRILGHVMIPWDNNNVKLLQHKNKEIFMTIDDTVMDTPE